MRTPYEYLRDASDPRRLVIGPAPRAGKREALRRALEEAGSLTSAERASVEGLPATYATGTQAARERDR